MLEKPLQDAMEGSPAPKEWLMVSVGVAVDSSLIKNNRAKFASA
jgi:hypothetical protein